MNFHPIEAGWERHRHVVKHLHRWRERWDHLTGANPRALEAEALRAGLQADQIVAIRNDRRRVSVLGPTCARVLDAHHDSLYAPHYSAAVESGRAAGRLGRMAASELALVGDNGVFVFARLLPEAEGARVRSAYRVTPDEGPEAPPAAFFESAVRRWRDKTSLTPEGR